MTRTDTLASILAARRKQVAADRKKTPFSELEKKARTMPPRDFYSAIVVDGQVSIIAESKRKSPSAGLLRKDYDPVAIAKAYERGGARAISILTEPERFGGRISDIEAVRLSTNLPILRKDFIFDAYQIVEARAHGADAVLLVAEMLEASELEELAACARAYQVEALVEIFLEESMDAALRSGARLIGINTRNLRTLQMVPDNVERLAPRVPAGRAVVAESGLKTTADIAALRPLPVAAALVGESLLRQRNLEAAVRKLAEAGQA